MQNASFQAKLNQQRQAFQFEKEKNSYNDLRKQSLDEYCVKTAAGERKRNDEKARQDAIQKRNDDINQKRQATRKKNQEDKKRRAKDLA